MRDVIVNNYKVVRQDDKVFVEDHSFRYWSVAEIVRRNQR